MVEGPLAPGASGLIDRISEGVGIVRERTIEIGSRVLWIDNIGSLVILRGQGNYTLAVIGALLAIVSVFMLQRQTGMALLLMLIGIAMIMISLSQKVDNGLSIGTTDGRSTLIISTDEQFLLDTLDLLCRKIDTGSITLQGTFDIGATHVNSGGGGIVVGHDGVAAGGEFRRPAPPTPAANEPQTFWAPQAEETSAPAQASAHPPRTVEPPAYDSEPYSIDLEERRNKPPLAAIASVVVLALIGIGAFFWWQNAEAERRSWEAVQQSDVGALRAYLSMHATGPFHNQAEAALSTLEEQRFNAARNSRDVGTLQAFLNDFPQSAHASAVNALMAQIRQQNVFRASAPSLFLPASGTVFDFYPRHTTVQWSPLAGAARYEVQVEMFDPGVGQWVEDPNRITDVTVYGQTYSFDFVGAQPGRWRVRGIDNAGNQSAFSVWWEFQYKR